MIEYGVFDWESDGLLNEVTQAWCCSIIDLESDDVVTYSKDQGSDWWQRCLNHLEKMKLHVTHNGINYDYWLMQKLYGVKWSVRPDIFMSNKDVKIIDTYILSQIVDPDRKAPDQKAYNTVTGKVQPIGPHSVESYAIEYGDNKVVINDWRYFNQYIIDRCEKDVYLQKKILIKQLKKMDKTWEDLL